MAHKKYRIEIADIDEAITAFVAGGDVAGPRTTYLCRHSTKSDLLAPLKAVMWPKGHRHPTYARWGGADGGEARRAARALGYVEEALSQHTLNDDVALQNAITRLAIRKPPHELRLMRFVDGGRLANVVKKYVDAEAALREMLGRPAERVDALRAMGEYLYCRLFAGIQAPPNQYGYDVVVGPASRPTTVQVKVARKAATNSAGLWIWRKHLDDNDAFDRLALFWLRPDSRIADFIDIEAGELREFAKGRGSVVGFDMKPKDIDTFDSRIRERSLRRLRKALADAEMTSLDATV